MLSASSLVPGRTLFSFLDCTLSDFPVLKTKWKVLVTSDLNCSGFVTTTTTSTCITPCIWAPATRLRASMWSHLQDALQLLGQSCESIHAESAHKLALLNCNWVAAAYGHSLKVHAMRFLGN